MHVCIELPIWKDHKCRAVFDSECTRLEFLDLKGEIQGKWPADPLNERDVLANACDVPRKQFVTQTGFRYETSNREYIGRVIEWQP